MMYDESQVELVRQCLIVSIRIAAPILMAGVIVGLVVSLVQTVTSIQDQTLTFVPKIVVMVGVAVVLLPWLVIQLVEFTREMMMLF